jgi:hypothetical protein
MTQPNPVRTLESHAVHDQTDGPLAVMVENCDHYMISIKTNSRYIEYVEQCRDCRWIDPVSLTWWAENAIKLSIGERAQRIAVATETEPFAFAQSRSAATDGTEDLDLDEVLGQALGAASMCWNPRPHTQEFDSTRARAIWTALKAEVERMMGLARQEAVEELETTNLPR